MPLNTIPATFDYDDYDGFVAFADAPAYTGYIGDWDLDTLLPLFSQRSAEGTLAIQYVGPDESVATIDVRSEPSAEVATREVSLPLTITNGELWATSYTDLTMVADFDDGALMDQPATEPVLALDNGDYVLTFRWLEAKDGDGADDSGVERAHVELVITPGTCEAPNPFPGASELL